MCGLAWSVPADETLQDAEQAEIDAVIDEVTRRGVLQLIEQQRQCQNSVELWRSDWLRGVTRYNENNSLRPWARDVMAEVDTLGETLRLVEDTELRNQLLDNLETIALRGCMMGKQTAEMMGIIMKQF